LDLNQYIAFTREKERKVFSEFIYPTPLKNVCVNHWAESVDFIEFDFFKAIPLERVLPQIVISKKQCVFHAF